MEPLPRGANFLRAKMLWEIGLHIAGNPMTRYGGNRDMCITIGNGSGEKFQPWVRLATGSPILAHDVVAGGIEMAVMNPSAFVTQAYRGVGLFEKPLPLRIVAVYPTWDRFVFLIHPRTGIHSLRDIKDARYPLHVSVKEDPTHSTRVFIDQALAFYGFSLQDIESWGGRLNVTGAPNDIRRMEPLREGKLDAIFDEGLVHWFDEALRCGLQPVELESELFAHLKGLGWRKVTIPSGRYPHLRQDYACIDYSGWPIYGAESLPEQVAYDVCAALHAREPEIPWEEGAYEGIAQIATESESTPMDVPLHPGAARWLREHR
jgi:TRAP-type uncharacterized transport system substrate-binding protein